MIRSALVIIGTLCLVVSSPASGEPITKEQWTARYKGLKERPLLRHEHISSCASEMAAEISEDVREEIEAMNTVSATEVIANVCALLMNAAVEGRLTYEQYREWLINPPDDIVERLQ
ncbi:hypothetical protein J2Z75_002374 [Rhizobium herbae]|uniref:Uncharacterized protein n=1 Tax=Rhizobium herbae TaxID=508661 RepID=A0ABS4ELN6_9HYPH|nr:hypothetical protein [Rhizobium herbae]